MKRIAHHRRSAGDTIIEVLIAIAIVSLVLGGAFVIVDRTLKNAQQAREHTEALKLLEGQLERMKALSKTPDNTVFTGSAVFCISSTNVLTPIAGSALPAASYPAACTTGVIPGGYRMGIIRGANNVFTARVNWDGPAGRPQQVELIYRLYP